jgi:hypothetical protein
MRPGRVLLLLALLCAALPRSALAQHGWSLTFSADGRSVYILTTGGAVDLWDVAAFYWPEALGGVVALAALVLLVTMRRRCRLRQIPGKPHCRKCGYCVEGCPTTRCPECGFDHTRRRPLVGRTRWRRALPLLIPLVVLVGGYTALLAVELPHHRLKTAALFRGGESPSAGLHWWSSDLLAWAGTHGHSSITGLGRQVQRIEAIDAVGTAPVRVIATWPRIYARETFLTAIDEPLLRASPDGANLVTRYGDDGLIQIDPRAGRIVRTITRPQHPGQIAAPRIAGFSPDNREVYVDWRNEHTQSTELTAWDLRTGALRVLFNAPFSATTRWFFIPGARPTFAEFSRRRDVLCLRDPAADFKVCTQVDCGFPMQFIGASADGHRVYLCGTQGEAATYDTAAGQQTVLERDAVPDDLPTLTPRRIALSSVVEWQAFLPLWMAFDPVFERAVDRAAITPNTRVAGPCLADLRHGRWTHLLSESDRIAGPFVVAPDGRRLAAIAHTPPNSLELLIYDLPDAEPTATAAGQVAPATP